MGTLKTARLRDLFFVRRGCMIFCCDLIFLIIIILKKYYYCKKKAISPFFDASGNKNIGATIRIGQEIRCLLYAEFSKNGPLGRFFLVFAKSVHGKIVCLSVPSPCDSPRGAKPVCLLEEHMSITCNFLMKKMCS